MTAKIPADSEYRLDIGGAVIALRCTPPGFAIGLCNWFGRPSSPLPAHVQLDVTLVPHDDDPRLPTSLITTKRLHPDGGFDIADGLIVGRYDAAARTGEIRVKQILVHGRLLRIFEQALYQAFWSARGAAGLDAFLIHSSAVIAGGRGFLFVGTSGAGKSTVARLSARHHVLGDEMNLVRWTAAGPVVAGTPFNGLFRAKKPGSAPLDGVFLLEQAPQHVLRPARKITAVPLLAREIAPPIGLDEAVDSETLPRMMEFADRLAGNSSLKVLEFLPDVGFWKVIGADFGLEDDLGA